MMVWTDGVIALRINVSFKLFLSLVTIRGKTLKTSSVSSINCYAKNK